MNKNLFTKIKKIKELNLLKIFSILEHKVNLIKIITKINNFEIISDTYKK